MAKSLREYTEWLDQRNLLWPKPPSLVPTKATAYTKPMKGIHAVTWSIYGTLLRISEGALVFNHPQRAQMQVALEKTIDEFNMWQSMTRKPGAPWEQLYDQYIRMVEEQQLTGAKKGDAPEVDAPNVWRSVLRRLGQKEFDYDMSLYGDPDELADKVAYFFHANLQGVEASPGAYEILTALSETYLKQALLTDGQSFSLVQLLRALAEQGKLPPLTELFDLDCSVFSFQEGVRKPSRSLYAALLERFKEQGIEPGQILHIGCNVKEDLAIAKQLGMRTALYAEDKISMRASKDDMKDAESRPDRLLTELSQLREVLNF